MMTLTEPPPASVAIEGYASLFNRADLLGDVVRRGAFRASLTDAGASRVRMLFQHNPDEPIGVWDEMAEDGAGLFVRGRIIPSGPRGAAAARLVSSGAIDGLSIGYRVKRAAQRGRGPRELFEVELWEVSIVTFPMAPAARLRIAGEPPARRPAA